jgi:hypothetical protein
MSNPEILSEDQNKREGSPVDPRSEVIRMFEALSASDPSSVAPMPELSAEQHAALCEMLMERGVDLSKGEKERTLKSLRRNQFRTRVDHPDFSSTRAKGVVKALGSEERTMELVQWAHNYAVLHEWDEQIADNPNARGRSLQQVAADILLIAMEEERVTRFYAIGRLNQRVLQGWLATNTVSDEVKTTVLQKFIRGDTLTGRDKMRGMPPGSLIDVWHFLRGETS